jgi:predicted DNA-binding transcriptional regulator YafY
MKVERLLSIVMLLMNKGRVTANELAEYFEVSGRTIVRDMEAINMAGIPIVSYQGKNGGFGILENFKLDKNFLTPDEISSMLRALTGISKAYNDRHLDNIMEKVQGLIPKDKRQSISRQSQKLIIDLSPWDEYNPQKKKVDLINIALEDSYVVSFKYTNAKGAFSERIVEPASLVLKVHTWYLYGYCREKQDYRLFKLSRMKDLIMLEESFDAREVQVENFPWQGSWKNPNIMQHIVMKFSSKVKNLVEDYYDEEQIEYLEDGELIVTVDYPEDEWVYGMILSYGSEVEVLKPSHIREIIKERALKIVETYKEYL